MRIKRIFLFLAILIVNRNSYAQQFTSFYPSDTIWKRSVHRVIDLDFPRNRLMSESAAQNSGYRGLMQIILDGLEHYGIDVYEKIEGGEFVNILTLSQVYQNLGSKVDTFYVENFDGETEMKIDKSPPDLNSVKRFEIIQEYFFIKSKSKFDSRIIAIRPIRMYTKELDVKDDESGTDEGVEESQSTDEELNEEELEVRFSDVGWFRFDQLAPLLAKEDINAPANQNAYSNYLSKFESGDFDSYIIKINNSFGKGIADYTDANENPNRPTLEMMLESHRIEYELFNFRMNLWEY